MNPASDERASNRRRAVLVGALLSAGGALALVAGYPVAAGLAIGAALGVAGSTAWRLLQGAPRPAQAEAGLKPPTVDDDAGADRVRLLHMLVQGSADALYVKDRAGKYRLMNPTAARLVGLDPALVIGRSDDELSASGAGSKRGEDARVMDSGLTTQVEQAVVDEGRSATYRWTKAPLRDAGGQVVGMYAVSRDVTMRRELEEQRAAALSQAEAARDMLADVLARVDDGFVALDLDWRYTYVNPKGARLLGRDRPEDLIGHHIWTEYPQGKGQPFARAYERAMATQQAVVLEEHYEPWGRWFENRIYPSPRGLSIYFTDITARKQAEAALREHDRRLSLSEQRYRLAAVGGHVWDWDIATGRDQFPTAFWNLLGVPTPQNVSEAATLQSLMHPDDVPVFRENLRLHLTKREKYSFEFRVRDAAGQWRWFQTQGQAVWSDDGRATYMAGTTFEITARKQAEDALRAAEAYRRNLFEQMADGVLLLDVEHRLLDANPSFAAMLGYERDELLAQRLPPLLAPHERPRLLKEVPAMMAGRPHLQEWDHLRRDGSTFPAEVSARTLDSRRYVAVVRDISTRREAERERAAYQAELSELARRLLAQDKTTAQRVAQALHDGLGQTLAVARYNIDAALAGNDAALPDLRAACERVSHLLGQAVRETRELLAELRPPLLDDAGLASALGNELAIRRRGSNAIEIILEADAQAAARRWPPAVEYAAFMIAREAVVNAQLHAHATRVLISLSGNAGRLQLDVTDNGGGLAPQLAKGRPGHLGIVGMRERALAINASFSAEACKGGGTKVSLHWEESDRE